MKPSTAEKDALFWAPQAWVKGRWQQGVCLEVDSRGHWSRITQDMHAVPEGATVLQGPVLPGKIGRAHV